MTSDSGSSSSIIKASPDILPKKLVMAYGAGAAAIELSRYLLVVLLFFYYTSVLGLSGQLTGFALMVALIVDAITDPLTALFTERLRSRWGKRHPFMILASVPSGILLILIFNPPGFVSTSIQLFVWLLIFAVLLRVALTVFAIPYLALGSELTKNYDERTRVTAIRTLGGVFGTALVIGLYYNLLYFFPVADYADPRLNPGPIITTSYVAGIVIVVCALIASFGTKAAIAWQHETDNDNSAINHTSFFAHITGIFSVENFRVLFIAYALFSLAISLTTAMAAHFALYFWNVSLEVQGAVGVLQVIAIGFGINYFRKLAVRLDKKRAFQISMVWFTVFSVGAPVLKIFGFFGNEGSAFHIVAYLTITVLLWFGTSGQMLTDSMIADVADESELKTGLRRSGFLFAAREFGGKVGSGVAAFIAGVIFDLSGLTPGMPPAEAPANSDFIIGIANSVVTGLIVAGSFIAFSRYQLSREQQAVISQKLVSIKNLEQQVER